jgi:uncharacterized protein YecT (DUF1311 family)
MGIAFMVVLAAAVNLSIACAGGTNAAPPTGNVATAKAATAEMERIYGLILQRFEQDGVFVAKFQTAQTAWEQYRDAHLEALYPAQDKRLAYGSVYGRCRQTALAALTRQRIEKLRPWLDGVAEGEVCAGSLPHR